MTYHYGNLYDLKRYNVVYISPDITKKFFVTSIKDLIEKHGFKKDEEYLYKLSVLTKGWFFDIKN